MTWWPDGQAAKDPCSPKPWLPSLGAPHGLMRCYPQPWGIIRGRGGQPRALAPWLGGRELAHLSLPESFPCLTLLPLSPKQIRPSHLASRGCAAASPGPLRPCSQQVGLPAESHTPPAQPLPQGGGVQD